MDLKINNRFEISCCYIILESKFKCKVKYFYFHCQIKTLFFIRYAKNYEPQPSIIVSFPIHCYQLPPVGLSVWLRFLVYTFTRLSDFSFIRFLVYPTKAF